MDGQAVVTEGYGSPRLLINQGPVTNPRRALTIGAPPQFGSLKDFGGVPVMNEHSILYA